jgi:hypothetical protein
VIRAATDPTGEHDAMARQALRQTPLPIRPVGKRSAPWRSGSAGWPPLQAALKLCIRPSHACETGSRPPGAAVQPNGRPRSVVWSTRPPPFFGRSAPPGPARLRPAACPA